MDYDIAVIGGGLVGSSIAEVQGREIADVGYYRVRPPVRPVTLGQMGNS